MVKDYGFRLYNPSIGKFLSVDPLSPQYPELTPYQFASNTPIQAIDLDGLEAFFIHGTESDPTRWTFLRQNLVNRDETLINALTEMSRSNTINDTFRWDIPNPQESDSEENLNYLWNDSDDRGVAARLLVDHVLANSNKIKGEYEKVTLIGHSHGGNVSIQAARILQDEFGIRADVITIATPAYNERNGIENPRDLEGNHIHIYNNLDAIDAGARGSERYSNDHTINLGIKADDFYKWYQGVDSHSFDNHYPGGFIQEIMNEVEENNPALDTYFDNNIRNQNEYENEDGQ